MQAQWALLATRAKKALAGQILLMPMLLLLEVRDGG